MEKGNWKDKCQSKFMLKFLIGGPTEPTNFPRVHGSMRIYKKAKEGQRPKIFVGGFSLLWKAPSINATKQGKDTQDSSTGGVRLYNIIKPGLLEQSKPLTS